MIYGEMNYSPVWGKVIVNINHLLLTLSSALNIIIYSYKVRESTAQEQLLAQTESRHDNGTCLFKRFVRLTFSI